MTLLAHHVEGEGAPVLLLNGIMMSLAAWEPIARELVQHYTVVRCDLRGQLLSPGAAPATIAEQAEEVARMLDAIGLERVHVAGTSFGGLAAIALAAIYPRRVSSLIAMTTTERADPAVHPLFESLRDAALQAASGEGDKGHVFDLIAPYTFSPAWLEEHGEALRERRDAVQRLPGEWFTALAGLLESVRVVDLTNLLPRIGCPTMVAGAEDDRIFPIEHSRTLAASIPGARLTVIPRAPHGVVVERPVEVAAVVRGFVQENIDR